MRVTNLYLQKVLWLAVDLIKALLARIRHGLHDRSVGIGAQGRRGAILAVLLVVGQLDVGGEELAEEACLKVGVAQGPSGLWSKTSLLKLGFSSAGLVVMRLLMFAGRQREINSK